MPSHTVAERAKNKKNFIQGAIKRPGAFTAKAKAAGALTKRGTIKRSFTLMEAKKPGLTGQQARLALTLGRLSKRRKK